MPNLFTIDKSGSLSLNFHSGQSKAWRSKRRFVFVIAGTQSGKTSWGPWWLWNEIQQTADPRGENDYIAATASFDLFKLKMLPEMRKVFEDTLGIARFWTGDRILELADPVRGFWAKRSDDQMWGRIILRSASAKGGLESATARGAWLDECGQDEFTIETYEAVRRRLSLSRGRILGTTTPYNLGWLKTEIYDRFLEGDPDIDVVNFPSYVNPAFSREEFDDAAAKMQKWRFDMFYRGVMGRPAGLIYDCYEDKIGGHLVEDFEIPRHWPRYVGIDFGGANTALVWIAYDPAKDIYYIYRESLSGNKSTKEHVRENRVLALGENVVAWTGGAASEGQAREDWSEEGIEVEAPEVTDVESGIGRAYGLFKTFRYRVFRSCKGLRDELGTYKRKLGADGNPTEEIMDKRKFHRLDALRYVSIRVGGKPKEKFRLY
jgi:hypothetical protein